MERWRTPCRALILIGAMIFICLFVCLSGAWATINPLYSSSGQMRRGESANYTRLHEQVYWVHSLSRCPVLQMTDLSQCGLMCRLWVTAFDGQHRHLHSIGIILYSVIERCHVKSFGDIWVWWVFKSRAPPQRGSIAPYHSRSVLSCAGEAIRLMGK